MRYVDLSSNYNRKSKTRPSLRYLKLTVALCALFFVGYLAYVVVWPTTLVVRQIFQSPQSALSFFRGDTGSLKSTNGRTNVLLLGVDKRSVEPFSYKDSNGKEHLNSFRSDTMVVISTDLTTKDSAMISLPRDLYVTIPEGQGVTTQGAKINAAYGIGNSADYPGSGMALAKKVVEEHTGVSIHYVVTIDFEGFKKTIDTLGGVMVNVENSFDDYNYPIEGRENDPCGGDTRYYCRYEHVHYEKGLQFMDGTVALKFARSRMGTNGEGSDFARARRQQRILLAIKNKALTWQTLSDPLKIVGLLNNFGQTIQTDFDFKNYPQVYKLLSEIDLNNVRTAVLDPNAKPGMIYVPPAGDYGGAYVLVPRKKDWSEVKEYVADVLNNSLEQSGEASSSAKPYVNPSAR